jgi:predicted site-specific integrase-resolvase
MTHDLMTAEQLALRLRVRPTTVKKWFRAGLIPALRLSPKVIRYDLAEVLEELAKRPDQSGDHDAQ